MKNIEKFIAIIVTVIIFGASGLFCVNVSASEDYTPGLKVKKINNGTGVKITISNVKIEEASYYLCISGGPYSDYESGEKIIAYLDSNDKTKKNTMTHEIKGMSAGTYYFRVVVPGNWERKEITSKKKKVVISKMDVPDKEIPKDNPDLTKLNKGDSFFMGHYEQDADMTNGREPIEWIVLSKTDKKILAISKYALDDFPYHNEYEGVTWENCSLRFWLNKHFLKEAFSKEERNKILKSKITTSGNEYGAEECKTKDRIFILSYEQASSTKLFVDARARLTTITEYCRARGGQTIEDRFIRDDTVTEEGKPACYWTLRGTRGYPWESACVNTWGEFISVGDFFVDDYCQIRPAMYVSIK